MKKLLSLSVIILTLGLLNFVACKKEENVIQTKNNRVYRENKFSTDKISNAGIDEKDKANNKQLFDFSFALSQLKGNSEILKFISEKTKIENNVVLLDDIIAKFPEMREKLKFSNNLKGDECPIEYNGQFYKLGIFCPNARIANPDKLPIIAAGFDLEDGENSEDADMIVGWELTDNGERKEINLTEKDVKDNTTPILISTLEPCGGSSKGKITAPIETAATPRAMQSVSSFGYKINERYDDTQRSEFTAGAYRCILGTNSKIPIVTGNDDSWWQIADVHKDNICKDMQGWVFFCPNFTPQGNNWVIFNTYERDWYASRKTLGCTDDYSLSVCQEILGRMKYSDNWYTFDPSLNIGAVKLIQLNSQWSYKQVFEGTTSKGYLDLWRVD